MEDDPDMISTASSSVASGGGTDARESLFMRRRTSYDKGVPEHRKNAYLRRRASQDSDAMPAAWRDSNLRRRSTIDSNDSQSSLLFDDEPRTRPCEPARQRRTTKSRFDVNSTRASLLEQLQEGSGTRPRGYRSSLTDCLEDMGFDASPGAT